MPFLCRREEIAEWGKEIASGTVPLFVIRRGSDVYAYVNDCPHTGASLNWGRDQFLSPDGGLIQCSFHGALFRIEDGLCVWGPCFGQRLRSVGVTVRDGAVMQSGSPEQ